jgi:hypothetical protein
VDEADYTIDQDAPGLDGSVVFNDVPVSGAKIRILGNTRVIQETDYVDNDGFPAETHERALDRLTMALLDFKRDLGQISLTENLSYPDHLVRINENGEFAALVPSGAGYVWINDDGTVEVTSAANEDAPTTIASITQSVKAMMLRIGDPVLSMSPTPAPGRVRLGETEQVLNKSAWPELSAWLAGLSTPYPWGSTATTFTLPRAAGYTLRFAATSSAVDTGGARTAGSVQTDQNKAHDHAGSTIGINPAGNHEHGVTLKYRASTNQAQGGSGSAQFWTGDTTPSDVTAQSGTHIHTGSVTIVSNGGDEVRVKNVAYHLDIVASSQLAGAALAMFGFAYAWDASTTAGDPGAGEVRANHATLASATAFYISRTDQWGVNLGGVIDNLAPGQVIRLSKVGAQGNTVVLALDAAPTNNGTYSTLTGVVRAAGGALAAADTVAFEIMSGAAGGDGVDATTTVRGIVELATTSEVTTGTDTVRAVTPAGVKAALDARVGAATTTASGIVELATGAEALAGTDTDRAVTPVALESALTFQPRGGSSVARKIRSKLRDHVDILDYLSESQADQAVAGTLDMTVFLQTLLNEMPNGKGVVTFKRPGNYLFQRQAGNAFGVTIGSNRGIVFSRGVRCKTEGLATGVNSFSGALFRNATMGGSGNENISIEGGEFQVNAASAVYGGGAFFGFKNVAGLRLVGQRCLDTVGSCRMQLAYCRDFFIGEYAAHYTGEVALTLQSIQSASVYEYGDALRIGSGCSSGVARGLRLDSGDDAIALNNEPSETDGSTTGANIHKIEISDAVVTTLRGHALRIYNEASMVAGNVFDIDVKGLVGTVAHVTGNAGISIADYGNAGAGRNSIYDLTFSNVNLDVSGVTGGDGMVLINTDKVRINNLRLVGCKRYGVNANNGKRTWINGATIFGTSGSTDGVLFVNGSSQSQLIGGIVSSFGRDNVHIEAADCFVSNMQLESPVRHNILVTTSAATGTRIGPNRHVSTSASAAVAESGGANFTLADIQDVRGCTAGVSTTSKGSSSIYLFENSPNIVKREDTTSGNFTVPSSASLNTVFWYTIVGAGAGGGGANGKYASSGGGGAGGIVRGSVTGLTPGSTVSETIGTGGAGGSSAGGNGGNGGSSSLGAPVSKTAGGGTGAAGCTTTDTTAAATVGGAGGTATGGTLNIPGQKGQDGGSPGPNNGNGPFAFFGGMGGSGPFGGGGSGGGGYASGFGSAGTGRGSGGGGACSSNQPGGAGTDGLIIWEYVL